MAGQTLLALMNAQMDVEVALVGEGLATRGARKRLLASVRTNMSEKERLVLELLAANMTVVRALLIAHGINNLLGGSTRSFIDEEFVRLVFFKWTLDALCHRHPIALHLDRHVKIGLQVDHLPLTGQHIGWWG